MPGTQLSSLPTAHSRRRPSQDTRCSECCGSPAQHAPAGGGQVRRQQLGAHAHEHAGARLAITAAAPGARRKLEACSTD